MCDWTPVARVGIGLIYKLSSLALAIAPQRASGERMASSSAYGRRSPSLRLADEWERCGDVESEEEGGENERSNDESEVADTGSEKKEVGIVQERSGKWRGKVNDKAHAALPLGGKPKRRCTPSFATYAEAVKALAELRDKVHQEYDAIILPRVQADPLVRGVPRAPDDGSTAVARKAYWVCNYNTNHVPKRMVVVKSGKRGFRWRVACVHCDEDNASQAQTDKRVVAKQPSCTAHGGVCEHDRTPHVCRGCQEESKKQMPSLCSHCQKTQLARKRRIGGGGNGLCPSCETYLRAQAAESGAEPPLKGKRWEDVVIDQLETMVTDTEGNVIAWEMRDDQSNMLGSNKRSRRGECSTEHQRRPDVLWLVRDAESRIAAAIMVEVDEDSHSDRESDCEGGKVHDTFQSLLKLAQEEGKNRLAKTTRLGEVLTPQVLFIRFNPNACDAAGGPIRLDTRIQVLAARVRELLNTPAEVYQQRSREGKCMKPYVELLYYHSKRGGKHLAFYEEQKQCFHLTPNRCPRA